MVCTGIVEVECIIQIVVACGWVECVCESLMIYVQMFCVCVCVCVCHSDVSFILVLRVVRSYGSLMLCMCGVSFTYCLMCSVSFRYAYVVFMYMLGVCRCEIGDIGMDVFPSSTIIFEVLSNVGGVDVNLYGMWVV